MRNQPKYHFFKNTSYAISGLIDIIKSETSFKIELLICVCLIPILFILDIDLNSKLLMLITLLGMPLVESINSAIERTVDLVTLEHHDMAKRAKDVGSAAVFISIVIFVSTWAIVLFDKFL
jgi:diacylglycerol kinase (ATP)